MKDFGIAATFNAGTLTKHFCPTVFYIFMLNLIYVMLEVEAVIDLNVLDE